MLLFVVAVVVVVVVAADAAAAAADTCGATSTQLTRAILVTTVSPLNVRSLGALMIMEAAIAIAEAAVVLENWAWMIYA